MEDKRAWYMLIRNNYYIKIFKQFYESQETLYSATPL